MADGSWTLVTLTPASKQPCKAWNEPARPGAAVSGTHLLLGDRGPVRFRVQGLGVLQTERTEDETLKPNNEKLARSLSVGRTSGRKLRALGVGFDLRFRAKS